MNALHHFLVLQDLDYVSHINLWDLDFLNELGLVDWQEGVSGKHPQASSWRPRHSASIPTTNRPSQEWCESIAFNESKWAVSALFHLLQHADLRFGIDTLLVDTFLGGLSKPLDTHGQLTSRPRTSESKFNSSKQQSIMSEIPKFSAPIGH